MARKCRNRCLPPHRRGVLTTLLRIGPRGPPAKVRSPSVYRAAIVLLLGKKRDAVATPNLRAPQAPSVCVRALATLLADELCGRLADGRLLGPAALIPVT